MNDLDQLYVIRALAQARETAEERLADAEADPKLSAEVPRLRTERSEAVLAVRAALAGRPT